MEATPPRPSTIRFARILTAARMSSPTPRLEAVSGAGTPSGSLLNPLACADSMMAVPSPNANAAVVAWPVGPRTPSLHAAVTGRLCRIDGAISAIRHG